MEVHRLGEARQAVTVESTHTSFDATTITNSSMAHPECVDRAGGSSVRGFTGSAMPWRPLVEDGKILKVQARLGHRDAATTLRHHAHATPRDDLDVVDEELDRRLNEAPG
jgi:hypothetical protein